MKYDYLNGTDFRMIRSRYYRFNSDTELLGRFMKVRRKDSVLDIGCSSGALLLYAACRRPAALYGIDLFAEVIDLEEQSILSAGVIVETELPESLTVYADEIKISQVIANYLSNAIKHTREGKKIIIRAFLRDDERTVRVEVQDEGSGIPDEELPYIWDRYQKSSRSFSRKLTNSGLGLAIVKAIADSHHAGYGVTTKLGEGSTFWIELRYPDEV